MWPPVPQGGAFVVCLGRPCGGECNPTTCSFLTCTYGCFAWLLTTEDPTTAGEDGVADEMWVRPVVMGSICSPVVGMNDTQSLWGGTWSIWPMLYKGDWVCMTGGVSLKSKSRSKDGRVSEREAGSENVCGVGEGISGWEDAWVVGRGISRSRIAWAVHWGISREGDACGGGGNSGAGDAYGSGGGVELVLGHPVSSGASRFAPSVSSKGSWAIIRWRQSTALSTVVICLCSGLPTM